MENEILFLKLEFSTDVSHTLSFMSSSALHVFKFLYKKYVVNAAEPTTAAPIQIFFMYPMMQ